MILLKKLQVSSLITLKKTCFKTSLKRNFKYFINCKGMFATMFAHEDFVHSDIMAGLILLWLEDKNNQKSSSASSSDFSKVQIHSRNVNTSNCISPIQMSDVILQEPSLEGADNKINDDESSKFNFKNLAHFV